MIRWDGQDRIPGPPDWVLSVWWLLLTLINRRR